MKQTKTSISKKWTLLAGLLMSCALLFTCKADTQAAVTAPTGVKQTSAFGTSAKVQWTAVNGAKSYKVEFSTDNKNWAVKEARNNYTVLTGLTQGQAYFLRVAAVDGTDVKYSTTSTLVTQPPKTSSKIVQTASKNTSVTCSWGGAKGATGYELYIGTDPNKLKYKGTTKNTKYTFKSLKKNRQYIVKVVPYMTSGSGFTAKAFESNNENIRTLPTKVTGVKMTEYVGKKVSATWNKKDNADGYQIKFINKSGKTVKTITTTKNKASYTKAESNANYRVKVRPYIKVKNNSKKYGPWSAAAYTIAQPSINKISQAKGTLAISWVAVSGATGYDIYIAKSNPNNISTYAKVGEVNKDTTTFGLTKIGNDPISVYENYYVYVKAKKKVGSKTYYSPITRAWYCQ